MVTSHSIFDDKHKLKILVTNQPVCLVTNWCWQQSADLVPIKHTMNTQSDKGDVKLMSTEITVKTAICANQKTNQV